MCNRECVASSWRAVSWWEQRAWERELFCTEGEGGGRWGSGRGCDHYLMEGGPVFVGMRIDRDGV